MKKGWIVLAWYQRRIPYWANSHNPYQGPNILELFFVSHPDLVTSCQTAPGIIIIEFSSQIKLVKRSPRETFLYHKANWDLVRESTARISKRYLNLNSTDERSVEENWKFLHEQYLQYVLWSNNHRVPGLNPALHIVLFLEYVFFLKIF